MSRRTLEVDIERWPIRGDFRISRGGKQCAEVVVARIGEDGHSGRGECVPYPRYGETTESVRKEISSISSEVVSGMTRSGLQSAMRPGAARNALDCALIDLEAKRSNMRAHEILGLLAPQAVRTAFTLSLSEPEAMARSAQAAVRRGHRLLKLKVAGSGDLERVRAVRAAAPGTRLVVDANEGWDWQQLNAFAPALAELGVALIEQPLKAEADEKLQDFVSPVPLCADESCHRRADLPRVTGRYSYINIKLDKAGGLTEAVALLHAAKQLQLGIMVGCMVATSLAMAPALLLGGFAELVDLDGPLLLERDREDGLLYESDLVHPAGPALWG